MPTFFKFRIIGSTLLGILAGLVACVSFIKGTHHTSLTHRSVFWFAFGTLFMFGYLGLVVGWIGQLQQCEITTDKSERRVVAYLRAVSEGHLIRDGGATIFIPKGEIKEIRCKWSGPLSSGRFL